MSYIFMYVCITLLFMYNFMYNFTLSVYPSLIPNESYIRLLSLWKNIYNTDNARHRAEGQGLMDLFLELSGKVYKRDDTCLTFVWGTKLIILSFSYQCISLGTYLSWLYLYLLHVGDTTLLFCTP